MKPAKRAVRKAKPGEREVVKEAVEKATGVHFEVIAPHPAFPLPVDRVEWFMRCRNGEEIAQTPYLNTAWKERRVGVWLESLAVGDTVDWIELPYGEERAGESVSLDYSRFEDPEFRATFDQKFPIVAGRIREYEKAVAEVAKKSKAKVQMRHAGSKGMLVFTVAALIPTKKDRSAASLGSAVEKSASALNEAYGKIAQL